MTDTQLHAFNLLFFRLISVGTLFWVIINLLRQLKTTHTKYNGTRMVILTLVGLTFIGNFLPIMIDLATLIGERYAGALLVPYAYSNAITGATTGIGWVMLYRTSKADRVRAQAENDELVADNKALTKDNKALRR